MIYLLHQVLYKTECLQEVEGGDCSAASFMASEEEYISAREGKLYDEGLNNKIKLALYRTFSKEVEVFAWGE